MEKDKNYVAELKKYARKTGSVVRYEDVASDDPNQAGRFLKRVKINSQVFDIGWGYTKKQAKQNAAKTALESLSEKENPRPVKRNSAKKCRTPFKQANITKVDLKEHEAKDCFTAATKEAKDGAGKLGHHHIPGNEAAEELSWSAPPDDGAPAMLSIPPTSLEISDANSKGSDPDMASTTSDSVVFTDSPSSSLDQEQNPGVKARRHLEPYFQGACQIRKKDVIPKRKSAKSDSSEKTLPQSEDSRFTSDFDCLKLLGKGGFGQVFKVKEKLTGIYFAIKIVTCKENRKCLREVKALAALCHRNIVRYFSCWIDNKIDDASDSDSTTQSSISDSSAKYLYIQMELCVTKTLRVWIDERNTQNVKKSLHDSKRREDSLTIAKQIVSGVEYIHSKNLIHRDLKPANILFGQDEEVKIGDFGLVTDEKDEDTENLVERTVHKGTPSYMAPEQKKQTIYDRKVDIFALGLIYFELFWKMSTVHEKQEVLANVREQKFPSGFLGKFPQEHKIIRRMLCAKPEDRPEASKLKAYLKECIRLTIGQKNMSPGSKSV